jgi:hypothetical protein
VGATATFNLSEVGISGYNWARGNGSAEEFGESLGGALLSAGGMRLGRAGTARVAGGIRPTTIGGYLRAGAAELGGMTLDVVAPPLMRQAVWYPTNWSLGKAIHGGLKGTWLHDPLTTAAEFLGFKVCFAAGTPLLTPDGHKAIEEFQPGDLVLSADENHPNGPVEPKVVEEVFRRFGRLLNLHIGGRIIRTTGEHPFFVDDRGWVPAAELRIGELLRSHDGQWVPVEGVADSGHDEVVYNLRVADFHTYFVGAEDWGFSVWAHNAYDTRLTANEKASVRKLVGDGVPVRDAVLQVKANRTAPQVEALYSNSKEGTVYYDRNGRTSTLQGQDFGLMSQGNLHAETGAMASSYLSGVRGGKGTLVVDTRALLKDEICGFCKTDIKTMGRLQQLEELTVVHISRQGQTTYVFPGEGLRTIGDGGMSWNGARL